MALVSAHAAQRFIQRIRPSLTPMEAVGEIMRSRAAIDAAARFGCHVVRRHDCVLLLREDTVATVVPRRGRTQMTRGE